MPDSQDQRQRMLRITTSGRKLWKALPDPISLILSVAFDDVDQAELATARRVLQAATERLNHHVSERNK
jgi:DNA-binding MarR family transcriptional regulator